MSSFSFENVVFYIQVLANLTCVRNFGKVVFFMSKHHDGDVFVKELHNLEKVHIK